MSTVIQYNNEFRKNVLKEVKEHHSIEELAEKYKVPAVVIKDWMDRDEAESYLDTLLIGENLSSDNRRIALKFFNKKNAVFLKEYFGQTCLLTGIIIVIFLCIYFRSDTEFAPSADPTLNLALQVDSVLIRSSRIESLMERHEETVNNISNTADDILINQEQQSAQLKNLIRKSSDIENLCRERLDECDASK